MKLLFFSVTKHQYRYFKLLKENLPCESRHIFFPTWRICLKGFYVVKKVDFTPIFSLKHKELDAKYKNRLHKALYKILLKLQAPWVVVSVYGEIVKSNPDIVCLWNGKKFHQAIVVEVAKIVGKKVLFFENGLLPNSTTMDFKGVNASNSVPREVGFFRELHFDKSKKLETTLQVRNSKKQKRSFGTILPKRYIFVPFQVAYDTQIIQHSPQIKDMRALFDMIELISKDVDISFVFKEHPSDRVSDYSDLHKKTNQKLLFCSENTQQLIENAEAVLTINSTVAIEGLLFHKRVIVLGEAFFAIDGIVKIAKNRVQLAKIIKNLSSWSVDEALVDNFLKYLKFSYLLPTSWKNPDERHYKEIAKRLSCV